MKKLDQIVYPKTSKLLSEDLTRKEEVYNRSPLGRAKKNPLTAPPDPHATYGVTTNFGDREFCLKFQLSIICTAPWWWQIWHMSGAAAALTFDNNDISDDVIERSKRHHRTHEPGEQRKLNYDWENTGINPNNHSFGKSRAVDRAGVHTAMDWAISESINYHLFLDSDCCRWDWGRREEEILSETERVKNFPSFS